MTENYVDRNALIRKQARIEELEVFELVAEAYAEIERQREQIKVARYAIEKTLNFINGVSGSPKEVLNLNMEALEKMKQIGGGE